MHRVLIWVAAMLACALTARLGVWQLDRAAQKVAMLQQIEERAQQPPLPVAQLARTATDAPAQWRRAFTVQGRWLPQATVFLDNRPMNGRAGFFVVTPLRLGDGTALAVLRGWTPRDASDRTRVPAVPTPDGEVTLRGHLAPWPSNLYDLGAEAPGAIRQNLDPAWYQQLSGLPLVPLVLQLDPSPAGDGPSDGLLRDWPAPAVDVSKHHGYAAQWFALSALVCGLTLWFQIIRPRLRRQRATP